MWRAATRSLHAKILQRRALLATISGAGALAFSAATLVPLHNDTPPSEPMLDKAKGISSDMLPPNRKSLAEFFQNLIAFAWGDASSGAFRLPTMSQYLSGVAWRDVVLGERYGVGVDAAGDVYHWGAKVGTSGRPICALKDKDIVRVALSPSTIFALSRSGKIYALPTNQIPPLPTEITPSPSTPLVRSEKITSISSGHDHLLALTSSGRSFAHPITMNGNAYGQLGTRKIEIIPSSTSSATVPFELVPKLQLDPLAKTTPYGRPDVPLVLSSTASPAPYLYEIPSLKEVPIAQLEANERSSYALTKDGKVLGWGANEYGQLALGTSIVVPAAFIPTETSISQLYPRAHTVRCTKITAGGDAVLFTVESTSSTSDVPTVDVLACGMGTSGILGNVTYNQAQPTPVKVKAVSGVMAYNEITKRTEPIRPHAISVAPSSTSPNGQGPHALLSLSALSGAKTQEHDLLAWGLNTSFQLGNGRRSSEATPQYMREFSAAVPKNGNGSGVNVGRMMLQEGWVKDLKAMDGRSVRKGWFSWFGFGGGAMVEQWPVTGCRSSAVYWRIKE